MENKSWLRLERQDPYWRMDRTTFIQFVSCICDYFRLCDSCIEPEYSEIKYADISYDDLKVVCACFGRCFTNEDTLLLAPVKMERSAIARGSIFNIYISEQKEDGLMSRFITMQTV